MKRYLFVQPYLSPHGGGEGVASWMLQALSERGSVTLLTWDPCDLKSVDEYYGTRLAAASLATRTVVPARLAHAMRRSGVRHELLILALLMREAKRLREKFDVCVSAFNELDLGGGAVQYIHFPYHDFDWLQRRPRDEGAATSLAISLYVWLCRAVSGWSRSQVLSNFTLANSSWTSEIYRGSYDKAADLVLFPPPLGKASPPSGARMDAFLSIGRVSPCKEWFKLIEIIERLRERGHDVGLSLAGSREDERLLERLREAGRTRPWLSLKLDLSRDALDRLIASHRYGLHGMTIEHYGMAVAELVLGGCLTMVPADGGQTEIVRQPELQYENISDAVDKLDRMLHSAELRERLLLQQSEDRSRLTRERFLAEFHTAMDRFEDGQNTNWHGR